MGESSTFVHTLRAYCARLEQGELLTGAELAEVLSSIVVREIEEGGPYAEDTDSEIDLCLNLVIARFLAAQDISLPKLNTYIELNIYKAHCDVHMPEILADEIRRHAERHSFLKKHDTSIAYSFHEYQIMKSLRSSLVVRLIDVSVGMRKGAERIIERTIKGNPDKQMSLMAYFLHEALGLPNNAESITRLGELGLANACFWSSFIVYDDFWDEDEAAEAQLLPVANLLARHYIHYFDTVLPKEIGFSAFFHSYMDKLDAANAWETVACRMRKEGEILLIPEHLPEYGDDFGIKFYPASGHIMGPVSLLVAHGYAIDSPEVHAFIEYSRHYLIAMQLNDDAHDWQEDLARGHISTAVSMLLTVWRKHHPEQNRIELVGDREELEKLFWFEVLVPLCESVKSHTTRARKALESLSMRPNPVLSHPAPLEQFITRNERIANEALQASKQSTEFLEAFLRFS